MCNNGPPGPVSGKEDREGIDRVFQPQTEGRDLNNPINWTAFRKWRVFITACYVTFLVGLNATAFTAAVSQINVAFNISDKAFPNSVWPVTAWNVGAALAPMMILPIMEDYGVRFGYLAVYAIFLVFVIPQAVAQNFATFLICRFFAGCCGGVLQDAMDGIIADIWAEPTQRSLPVSMYILALFAGVSVGPVIGGAIIGTLDWRWIFYVQIIIYGGSAPFIFLLFRETRSHIILSRHNNRLQKPSTEGDLSERVINPPIKGSPSFALKKFVRENMLRPFMFLFTEPVVFFFTLLSALSYGLLFLATQSVPQVYSTLYAFDEQYTGLIQSAIVVGEALGFLACAFIGGPYFARATAKSKEGVGVNESQLPEVRLHLAVPTSFIGLTGGLFLYGWTSYPRLTFWAPTVGLILIGFGSTIVMQAIMMYITDAYVQYAASASAAVCFGENLMAAFLPLASQSMYTKLGFQWASTLLAFVALALSFAPVVLSWKGRAIRKRSPFLREAMMSQASRT